MFISVSHLSNFHISKEWDGKRCLLLQAYNSAKLRQVLHFIKKIHCIMYISFSFFRTWFNQLLLALKQWKEMSGIFHLSIFTFHYWRLRVRVINQITFHSPMVWSRKSITLLQREFSPKILRNLVKSINSPNSTSLSVQSNGVHLGQGTYLKASSQVVENMCE